MENLSRVPTLSPLWKAKPTGAPARAPAGPGVVVEPGMCARSLRGNREISSLTVDASIGRRPASGRRGAVADDVRAGEVRLGHTSEEACEQGRATGGVGGAKGRDQ